MLLKIGREEYEITSQDVVMYNGASYQLITQKPEIGRNRGVNPQLTATRARKLIKDNILVESERAVSMGIPLIYYKFNV